MRGQLLCVVVSLRDEVEKKLKVVK